MSSRTYHACSRCGKIDDAHAAALYYHTTVCDGCGFEQRMPSSWTQETNPVKGWITLSIDGGMIATIDFCPKCVALGMVLAYIEKERQDDEQGKRTKAAESARPSFD